MVGCNTYGDILEMIRLYDMVASMLIEIDEQYPDADEGEKHTILRHGIVKCILELVTEAKQLKAIEN